MYLIKQFLEKKNVKKLHEKQCKSKALLFLKTLIKLISLLLLEPIYK